jgi:hypothetical protein
LELLGVTLPVNLFELKYQQLIQSTVVIVAHVLVIVLFHVASLKSVFIGIYMNVLAQGFHPAG